MKIAKWIILGVIALVVIAVVIVFLNLNSIVRRTIESQSTAQLKVPTTLGGATISIFNGDVSLKNYDVGSPEGYKSPQMLSVGELAVDTSWSGIRSDPVKIESISIDKPKMVLEMQGTTFNIKKFIDGLPKSDEPTPAPSGEPSKPLKLIIGTMSVRGAQVILKPDAGALASLPGIGDKLKPEYTLNIPDIAIQNIGTGEGNQNGAAIKDVATLLLTRLADEAAKSKDLPPELQAILSGDLAGAMESLKAKGMAEVQKRANEYIRDKVTGQIGDQIGGKAGDLLKKDDAGKAVNDLLGGLGGKKKDEEKKK